MSFAPDVFDDFQYACDLAMSYDGDRIVCVDADWELVDALHVAYAFMAGDEVLVSGKTPYSLHEVVRSANETGWDALVDAVKQGWGEDRVPISAYVLPL